MRCPPQAWLDPAAIIGAPAHDVFDARMDKDMD